MSFRYCHWYQAANGNTVEYFINTMYMYRGRLKGSPQVWWILFLLLLTTYFCLVLPAAFTRHGKHLLSDPCTSETWFQNHSSAYYWPTSSLLPFFPLIQSEKSIFDTVTKHTQSCASAFAVHNRLYYEYVQKLWSQISFYIYTHCSPT